MRILFVGNFRPAHSTENDLRWTMEDMGHEVVAVQEDTDTTDRIYKLSQNCDLFFYVHTHGWVTPGSLPMDEIIRRITKKIPTVAFHLDYWFGLKRASDVGRDAFWTCQYVFTADGDPATQKWFEAQGINHRWSPPAVVKRDCYLTPPVRSLEHDIIFVGSYEYHDEWPYRRQVIDWLYATYGRRFKRFGNPQKDDPSAVPVRGHELNQVYASSKVVVGDSLCLGFDHTNYWSDRVYETRGRGGLLIHPDIKGLDAMIVKYKFGDFKELKRLIDLYLSNDEMREKSRRNQFEYVKTYHTYHNRLADIFKIVGATK